MYDPNWPQNGQLVDGDRFREQFAGIIDLIQAGGGGVSAATVDSVSTGNPGDPATAGVTLVGATLHFTFAIPRGSAGDPGPPGPPGEVTNASLAAAIFGTSNNSNSVATLDTAPNNPPTVDDYEVMRGKLNELIGALRRNP